MANRKFSLIYFNNQDEDGNWYSILKPGLDIEDVKHNYVYRWSFELLQASTMPNALGKLNIEFVNGKMQKNRKRKTETFIFSITIKQR